jgi:hypothetical protein
MIDTSTQIGRGVYSIYQRYDQLRFTGYIQPQWQWASDKGVKSYSGGDFGPYSNDRFMLRRGRLRVDYIIRKDGIHPVTQFVLQVDATERGVVARDIWGRYFENRLGLFSFTAGLFARPFGYEVNLSSSDREAPERGRASQILMRNERDLGFMVSLDPRGKLLHSLRWLKLDVGVFNGQGLISPGEYDSYKDIIARLYVRPVSALPNGWRLSGGVSVLEGAIFNPAAALYKVDGTGDNARIRADSFASPKARRSYIGADVQLKIPNGGGRNSEFRAEYLQGTQTGTIAGSETPGTLPTGTAASTPFLVERPFNAAYFSFLQNIFSSRHQLGLKYDWYDANTRVQGQQLIASKGFNSADVRFDTFGGGYIFYITPQLKATFWYEHVLNEKTLLPGFTEDVSDDVFTSRLQFRF